MSGAGWLFMLAAALLNATAQVMVKRVVSAEGVQLSWRHLPALAQNPVIIAAVAVQVLGMLCWWVVLSRAPLNVAVPAVTGLLFLFVLVASVVLLGETVGLFKLLGVCLITAGVALLAVRV